MRSHTGLFVSPPADRKPDVLLLFPPGCEAHSNGHMASAALRTHLHHFLPLPPVMGQRQSLLPVLWLVDFSN